MKGKKIILGVTGSIAAYKSVYLLRLLKKAGADVKVVLSESVNEFVGPLTFSSLSGSPVFQGLWNENWSAHVELGIWGDLMIVAPTTAHTIAKFANGLCDNALTAVHLAAKCPVMIAPAMDLDMYLHPRTQANLHTLQLDGATVLPTGEGFLASGLTGPGRMLEPEDIFDHAVQHFGPKPLEGKSLLITAGPTREALDPVRYISNHSSGKMGYALAKKARDMGASVTLVSGPTQLNPPIGIKFVSVTSGEEMLNAVLDITDDQDIMIMAAAVVDYAPASVASQKIKKKTDDFALELIKTKDILKTVGLHHKKGHQILVGFALETNNEEENAQKKLEAKNLDLIVLNSLQDKGAGFGHDTNKIAILDKNGSIERYPLKSKAEVATDILNKIIDYGNL